MISNVFFHFLFANILINPWFWSGVGVLLLAAGFYLAPKQTLIVLTNWRTWAIAIVVLAVIAFLHAEDDIAVLKAQNVALAAQVQPLSDAMTALTAKSNSDAQNAQQQGKLNNIITQAPQGTAQDAAMDEIAADQAATPLAATAPSNDSATDRVLDSASKP